MKYIVLGKQSKTLEDVLAREDVEVQYRASYVPVLTVETKLELEELRQLLPDYQITKPKEVYADDKLELG